MFLGSSVPVISAQIGLGLIFILRLLPNLKTVLRNSFLEIMPQLGSFVVVKIHTFIVITMCLALILKDYHEIR